MEKVVVPGVLGGKEDAKNSNQVSNRSRDKIDDEGSSGVKGEINVGEEDVVGLRLSLLLLLSKFSTSSWEMVVVIIGI